MPTLDSASCKLLGQSDPIIASVQGLFKKLAYADRLHNPVSITNGEVNYLSFAERSADRNRIYPFFAETDFSVVEIERMLLLGEFEAMLKEAQVGEFVRRSVIGQEIFEREKFDSGPAIVFFLGNMNG